MGRAQARKKRNKDIIQDVTRDLDPEYCTLLAGIAAASGLRFSRFLLSVVDYCVHEGDQKLSLRSQINEFVLANTVAHYVAFDGFTQEQRDAISLIINICNDRRAAWGHYNPEPMSEETVNFLKETQRTRRDAHAALEGPVEEQ